MRRLHKPSRSTILWLTAAVLVIAITTPFFPSSLAEMVFQHRLGKTSTAQQINLAELTTFEWKEVCSHHPYDGDFKHPESGQIYAAPTNAANNGTWSLLFIAENGSPTYLTGSCQRGGIIIADFGCRKLGEATLHRLQSGDCPTFK